jgi:aryl-alcohol dehydrogenase-like predicted oxidoreductase
VRTRRIGSLEVPVVGLGTNNFGWRLDEQASAAVVRAALDERVTLIDTADIYGGTESEAFIGRALGTRRDEAVLATKFGKHGRPDLAGGAAPDYVRASVEGSLARLRTDRIDLVQLHEPRPETPIADTLGALTELVGQGKVREIGCSNFSGTQLREAEGFACVQNELNVLEPNDVDDGLAMARELGMAYLPYYPLANGLLTGKYRRGEAVPVGSRLDVWYDDAEREEALADATFDRIEALEAFAADRDRSLLELAFGWLLAQAPVASVIAGATSPEQVRANAAAGGWIMTPDDLAAVP